MSAQGNGRLRKELTLLDVYAISTGAMFSSGFFLLPGLAAAQTGPSVALAYVVAGLFIVPAMLSVAELATAMPRAGGAYYFLDRSLGPLVGTVGGLGTWLALVLKSSFALVGMGAYLALYFELPMEAIAIGLTVLFAGVNVVGAKETSGLQRVLVATLVVIMLGFILYGVAEVWSRGAPEVARTRFTPFMPFGVSGFMATVGFVFVSYAGLTKVASVAEEVRAPARNIPLGMMLSLATAAVVYGLGVAVVVALLPATELRGDLTPIASAARALDSPGGAAVALVVVAAIAAFASTGNAGVLSASRYPLAMARDRLVSARFGALGRFRTPWFSIGVTALLMIVAIVSLPVEAIAKLASAFQLLLFSLLNVAVVIMRESRLEAYDPGYRSPLYPWMQIVGFVSPLWLIAELGQLAILFTLCLVAATVGWYFYYAAHRVERTGAIFHAFARLGERRHGDLEGELRVIAREQDLREGDRFEEVVARAGVLDYRAAVRLEELIGNAVDRLGAATGLPADRLRSRFAEEFRAGFVPVSRIAAIPHLRVAETERPALVIARCNGGIRLPDCEDAPERLPDVGVVLFLVSPERGPGRHLRLLGHLATRVEETGFEERWWAAEGESALKATLLGGARMVRLLVVPGLATGAWIGRPLQRIRLPAGALVAVIHRRGHDIVPHGGTVLEAGDWLSVIGEAEAVRALEAGYPLDAPGALTAR